MTRLIYCRTWRKPAVPLQLLTLPTELSAAQHATCNMQPEDQP